jgi:hypothetical protein
MWCCLGEGRISPLASSVAVSTPERLSPVQKRYKVLTHECGLDHEEALHALGRRSGGLPEYRKLSRLAQLNKVQELIGYGLTKDEAERAVGLGRVPTQPASDRETGSLKSESPPCATTGPGSRNEPGSNPSAGTSASGMAQNKCYYCKRTDGSVVNIPPGVWLCKKCRKLLRRARRAERHRTDTASYCNALTHPELRGLKGVRK